MKTIKKLLVPFFAVMLLAANISCSGGNEKLNSFIADYETWLNKWEAKTSDGKTLNESEKEKMRNEFETIEKAGANLSDVKEEEVTAKQKDKMKDLKKRMLEVAQKAKLTE